MSGIQGSTIQLPNLLGKRASVRLRKVDIATAIALVGLSWLLLEEAKQLWRRPHYQFFPVAIIAFSCVMAQRGDWTVSRCPVWRRRLSVALAGLGTLAAFGAASMFAPWAAHLSALCIVSAWCIFRFGNASWFTLAGWLSILWITLPIPFGFDYKLVQGLQRLSAWSATGVLDTIGVIHSHLGVVFSLKHGNLFIDEACSGVNSLYALTALAIMYGVWRFLSSIPFMLLIGIAPMWSWVSNTLRLVVIGAALDWYHIDLSHGWKHDVLGLMIMVLASAGLICTAALIEHLWGTVKARFSRKDTLTRWWTNRDAAKTPPQTVDTRSGGRRGNDNTEAEFSASAKSISFLRMLRSPGLIGVYVVAGACLALSVRMDYQNRNRYVRYADLEFNPVQIGRIFSEKDLPEQLLGMQLVEYEQQHRDRGRSIFGENSIEWKYRDGNRTILVSLDFPFAGFHPLEVCYVNTGHLQLAPRQCVRFPATHGSGYLIEEAIFRAQNAPTDAGLCHLFYMEFAPNGEDIWRPRPGWSGKLLDRAVEAFYSCFSDQRLPATFQLQVFVRNAELTAEDKQRYRQLLIEARRLLLPKIRRLVAEAGVSG